MERCEGDLVGEELMEVDKRNDEDGDDEVLSNEYEADNCRLLAVGTVFVKE
jgi:hypothetical protein